MSATCEYFECGKYKFRLGTEGITEIGMTKDGVWLIRKDDGTTTVVVPNDTFLTVERENSIVKPSEILAEEVA